MTSRELATGCAITLLAVVLFPFAFAKALYLAIRY